MYKRLLTCYKMTLLLAIRVAVKNACQRNQICMSEKSWFFSVLKWDSDLPKSKKILHQKKKKLDARKYNFEKNGFMRFIFCLVFFE